MLLGNLLLALAWAALQGHFSLATLVTGHVLGYLILLALVRGGDLRAAAEEARGAIDSRRAQRTLATWQEAARRAKDKG